MRTPTPVFEVYRWHWETMNGLNPPIHEIEPQPGWYKIRLVRGGPMVPVEIWLDQETDPITGELTSDELLCCTVNGEPRDPLPIWTRLRPISQDEFRVLTLETTGAAPRDPMKRVNLMQKAVGPNG